MLSSTGRHAVQLQRRPHYSRVEHRKWVLSACPPGEAASILCVVSQFEHVSCCCVASHTVYTHVVVVGRWTWRMLLLLLCVMSVSGTHGACVQCAAHGRGHVHCVLRLHCSVVGRQFSMRRHPAWSHREHSIVGCVGTLCVVCYAWCVEAGGSCLLLLLRVSSLVVGCCWLLAVGWLLVVAAVGCCCVLAVVVCCCYCCCCCMLHSYPR